MGIDKPLAIIGTGGHATSVSDAATSAGFTVIKFFEYGSSEPSLAGQAVGLEELDFGTVALSLGIGTNFVREKVYKALLRDFPDASFPPIIHSAAWVSPQALLAPGSVVLAHATVGPSTRIGTGGILNTGSSLDHDGQLGAFASLGPGARTGGYAIIGERTMIGLQAGILQGRTIGEDTVVGAHSLVVEDIPPLSVAMGTPCRVTRSREWDESYY